MVSVLLDKAKAKRQAPVSVHFLGTCGGPLVSRACSSLAVDFGNDIWIFDAADGTTGRLHQSSLKMSNISRIFITHMHADHTLGLVSILTQIMCGVGVSAADLERQKAKGTDRKADINIFGPVGLRKLIRTSLQLVGATLAGAYAVHELLGADEDASAGCSAEEMLVNEAVGKDIRASEEGVWEKIMDEGTGKGGRGWSVSAGPLDHRVPSQGYVLNEPTPREPLDTASLIPILTQHAAALKQYDPPVHHPLSVLSHLTSLPPPPPFVLPDGSSLHPPPLSGQPPRKLVIFGDCSGGTPNSTFQAMCADASLLVHECTNAHIAEPYQKGEKGRRLRVGGLEHSLLKKKEVNMGHPLGEEAIKGPNVGEDAEKKREEVQKKARSRGHSTPKEVGEFAKAIKARRVVINHFSAMFPSPRYHTSSPFPSLLSPTSPFPAPTPYPMTHSSDPPIPPLPLTSTELHTRIIMQNIADQVNEVWNGDGLGEVQRQCVPARDFMVVRIPGHELDEVEVDEQGEMGREVKEVMASWAEDGGAWVKEGKEKRWVGVSEAPGET
ncbi:beta-lactamase-like protein [Dioszegia hungarica]|uniref:Beta-lactamase-like protein n=1 Tax=Dioszegia hungarica TaxID=4972 RepID=A0AA38LUE5_9TREE|nr:beta-lactamase-like protein [Dioszegia hungarica]KAI9637497.1 beta-lactamase-like protein [Dioszegia hungarica]